MRAVNDPRVDRERSDFVRLESATSCGLHPYRRYPDATCNMKGPLFETRLFTRAAKPFALGRGRHHHPEARQQTVSHDTAPRFMDDETTNKVVWVFH